jgi:hypothetical protein
MNTSDPLIGTAVRAAPMALVRSGLAMVDLVALPLLASAFLVVLGIALASLGIAAGGINFILGLRFLDFFPTFPWPARLLSGLTLLAFSALMMAAALLLAGFFRESWKRFWSWHRSTWQGTFEKPDGARVPGHATGGRNDLAAVKLSGLVFVCLLAMSFALMMLMAGGPFWHAWRWFV